MGSGVLLFVFNLFGGYFWFVVWGFLSPEHLIVPENEEVLKQTNKKPYAGMEYVKGSQEPTERASSG